MHYVYGPAERNPTAASSSLLVEPGSAKTHMGADFNNPSVDQDRPMAFS